MLSSAILATLASSVIVQAAVLPRQEDSTANAALIQYNGQCLAADARPVTNGTPLHLITCDNTSNAQQWYIETGNNPSVQIKANDADFCLDAGSDPRVNGPIKVWSCYPTLFQQTWTYDESSGHIYLTRSENPQLCLAYSDDELTTVSCDDNEDAVSFTVTSLDGGLAATTSTVPVVSIISSVSEALATETDANAVSSLASVLSTAAAGITGGVVVGGGAQASGQSTIASITSVASSLVSSVSVNSEGSSVVVVATNTVTDTVSRATASPISSAASAASVAVSSASVSANTSAGSSTISMPFLALGLLALPFLL